MWPLLCRRRPTLPHTFACSTIGPAGLNFRVRDGNGWIPRGKITDVLSSESLESTHRVTASCNLVKDQEDETSQLNRLVYAETAHRFLTRQPDSSAHSRRSSFLFRATQVLVAIRNCLQIHSGSNYILKPSWLESNF